MYYKCIIKNVDMNANFKLCMPISFVLETESIYRTPRVVSVLTALVRHVDTRERIQSYRS